jgi:hypothetical protein
MSSTTITTETIDNSGEIITDKHALNLKHQMMDKLKWNALLGSVAETCKFMAGPLTGFGLAGLMAVQPFAIPVLIAAAVSLAVGVAAGYASTRIWQSGQFDNFELNAESTARHLVQELKTSRTTLVEEHGMNQRADGKKWVQVVNKDQQAIGQQT